MITDLNDSSIGKELDADICIVGAGAAGISIAHSLLATGLKITLLESGGGQYEPATEALNKLSLNDDIGANVGGDKFDRNRACRLRYFGGTTNHWTGWCRPLDDIDFKERSWVPMSGWPITRQDLDPYYKAAEQYCDITKPVFFKDQDNSKQFPDYSPEKLESIFWSISPPTRFGVKYKAELEASQNVTILMHSNVTEIVTDESEASVTSLTIRSLEGKEASIKAKRFIVATGALENARLLLVSNKKNPNGVGNQSGMVGKNYQNHPHIQSGLIKAADPEALSELYTRVSSSTDNTVLPGIAGTEAVQEELKILNFGATITPVQGKSTARQMLNDLKAFQWPDDFTYKMKTVVNDLVKSKSNIEHQIYMYTEQAPSTESLVRLSDEKDALGMPRVFMDWKLNPLDKHTVKEATMAIAEEVGRLNIGRFKVKDWVMEDGYTWPPSLWGGCHQIGTTRMSGDAEQGVVDKNCQVHGLDNLYVAGSSVFTTGGHVPPTFTVVALALRLADHIKSLDA